MSPNKAIQKPGAADNKDLDTARRVLDLEAQGIHALANSLDGAFVLAVDLISGLSGHVVVTGMGKSGHVACKIAATMASTGTPALFVHPGEASHGDLGMIRKGDKKGSKGDAVIALSSSGETSELADLVAYAKRFEIPLITMTRDKKSTLANAADVALILPSSDEACPMGLAPTTSTTAMLALGDALAVALLERKGFSSDDFQVLHPGGQLGRRLIKVADIMHSGDELPMVDPDATMADALIVMTAKSFGIIGISGTDGRLNGIITDGDLRRHMSPDLLSRTTADVMTKGALTIGPDAVASEAVQIMNANSITALFVVETGVPVGIVHIHDCLRAGVA